MRILARFMLSASDLTHFPPPSVPEIAFLGRSNVGKSSVINSLVGAKLARTSNTPGRTRSINFYEVRRAGQPRPELRFADLPGYGYARVPSDVKREWGPMVEKYLATRPNLVLSIVITDSRHGPTKLDLQMIEWLQSKEKPFVIIATKADKLSGNQMRANISRGSAVHDNKLIAFSAVTRMGADRIWKEITARISDYQPRISD